MDPCRLAVTPWLAKGNVDERQSAARHQSDSMAESPRVPGMDRSLLPFLLAGDLKAPLLLLFQSEVQPKAATMHFRVLRL
jgi:hypothetical protein